MIVYVLQLVLACVCAYQAGRATEKGNEASTLIFLILGFLNFFLGFGGLLNA